MGSLFSKKIIPAETSPNKESFLDTSTKENQEPDLMNNKTPFPASANLPGFFNKFDPRSPTYEISRTPINLEEEQQKNNSNNFDTPPVINTENGTRAGNGASVLKKKINFQ